MFQNHEIIKIVTPFPLVSSILIFVAILIITVLSTRISTDTRLLNESITEQLRGLAIFFVVVGHIGVNTLAANENFLKVGQYGVSIFFILSGFGLARSYQKKDMVLSDFLRRRFSRVMIPYWIATFVILILDFFLLSRTYSISVIISTILGINLTDTCRHIDYARWYITVLIIWYMFFYLFWKRFNRAIIISFFFLISCILLLFSYYVLNVGYAFASFPFGVLMGLYYSRFIDKSKEILNKKWLPITAFFLMAIVYISRHFLDTTSAWMPNIILAFANDLLLAVFSLSFIIFFSTAMSKTSTLLKFVGKYSYEIFLLHGVFMVRYDFILYRGPLYLTFWPYFVFILGISMLMQRLLSSVRRVPFNA